MVSQQTSETQISAARTSLWKSLRTQLQPGMIVSLQRGPRKAKFRIAWIRQLVPNELQAGVECLEPQSNFGESTCLTVNHEAKKDMQALIDHPI